MPESGLHGVRGRNAQERGGPDWAAVRDLIEAYARSFGLSYDDRQDVIQRASVRVWTRWATFRGQSKRSTWIYRVVRNEFLSWRRNAVRDQVVPLDGSPGSALVTGSREDEVLCEIVAERWLSELSVVDQSILKLRYRFALTSEEIGNKSGLAASSVRARLHRLRGRLSIGNLERAIGRDLTPSTTAVAKTSSETRPEEGSTVYVSGGSATATGAEAEGEAGPARSLPSGTR